MLNLYARYFFVMTKHSLVQGYGLLALQAHLPSLHPPPCNIEAKPSNCKEVHGWNSTLLFASLYISAVGDGCMRACMPSLGADQFDHENPTESRQQSSFFNWYTFGISFGGFIGLILVVWLQNDKGWDIGFGLCAILILLGLLVVAVGLPFYRNQIPEGSPLTRILQVVLLPSVTINLISVIEKCVVNIISLQSCLSRFLWSHSETGALSFRRNWKKHKKAVLSQALLKYSLKQKA
jgi:dipeptide/tripeptide permease